MGTTLICAAEPDLRVLVEHLVRRLQWMLMFEMTLLPARCGRDQGYREYPPGVS